MNDKTNEIFVSLPQNHENATPAVAEALSRVPKEGACRIVFETGEYHFYPEGTTEREFWPSNNDGGVKKIVFPLFGFKHLTVDGNGSVFVIHGRISPFIAWDCEDLRLCNFTVDCGDSGYCQGTVLSCGKEGFELKINREEFPYRVDEKGALIFTREYDEVSTAVQAPLLQEFDAKVTGPAWGQGFVFLYTGTDPVDLSSMPFPVMRAVATETGGDTVSFRIAETGKRSHNFVAGNELILKYENRENPGIFLWDSKDVTVSDVTLYRSLGMGVVAETTENVTLLRYRAVTRPGRTGLVGVLDDATHFVNCSGRVELRDCVLEHMMDDCVNIHGIYATVSAVDGNVLTVKLNHGQQKGVNVWKPGDKADLQKAGNLAPLGTPTVLTSELSDDKTEIRLTLDVPVPAGVSIGDLCENSDRMPEVLVTGCRMGHNRPRGVLMTSTKPAVIENNFIYTSQHGVEVCGDCAYWFESGRVTDLTVRGNVFKNCGYNGGDYAVIIAPGFPEEAGYFHGKITVKDNLFDSFGPGMVYAYSAAEVCVTGNRWVRNHDFLPHTDEKLTVKTEHCGKVTVENNRFDD